MVACGVLLDDGYSHFLLLCEPQCISVVNTTAGETATENSQSLLWSVILINCLTGCSMIRVNISCLKIPNGIMNDGD